MFGADELVLQPLSLGLGELKDELQPWRDARLGSTVRLWNLAEELAARVGNRHGVGVHFAQELRHDTLALLGEGDKQVFGFNLRVVRLLGAMLSAGDGLLGLLGVLVDVHGVATTFSSF